MFRMRRYIVPFLVVGWLCIPGEASAQRFTTKHPSASPITADTLGDENGRLAFQALMAGKTDEARDYLNDADPQGAYAAFVKAALTQDAVTAANMYKEIVAQYAGRSIAREALLQLYRYHYAIGDYTSAHRDYVELKKFPQPPPVIDPVGLKDSLEALPPSPSATESPEASTAEEKSVASNPLFTVQVGVFTTPENARKFIENLKMYGVSGAVFTKDDGGRTLYGVSAGTFSSRAAAEDLAASLRARSLECIVVQR